MMRRMSGAASSLQQEQADLRSTDVDGVHRGRPRSIEADRAIAQATLELLAEDGWAGLTMSGVAHRAGVSTATLYRRYSSKEDLVCAAITAEHEDRPNIDHGSLEADLRAKLSEIVEKLQGDGGRIARGVVGEAMRNDRLGEIMRNTVMATGRGDLYRMIERAVQRGEIRAPDDIDVVVSLLAGPVLHRFLFSAEPVTPDVVDRLLPLLLAALGARGRGHDAE